MPQKIETMHKSRRKKEELFTDSHLKSTEHLSSFGFFAQVHALLNTCMKLFCRPKKIVNMLQNNNGTLSSDLKKKRYTPFFTPIALLIVDIRRFLQQINDSNIL